jgi:hypothetical protein
VPFLELLLLTHRELLSSVSLAYKESANCRLEANYVHKHTGNLSLLYGRTMSLWNVPHMSGCLHLQGMQNECDMVPLMMQSNFKAKGWLGLILGTRLWCKSVVLA